ncbi:MAG: helicase associated domain-containing protein [Paraclostridium sp.]
MIWQRSYQRLSYYIDKHGRYPQQKGEYVSLAKWVTLQRRLKRCGTLCKGRELDLLGLNEWSWSFVNVDKWDQMYKKLIQYYETYKKIPKYTLDVGVWVGSQKDAYKKGKLSKEREMKLSSLPFWRWDNEKSRWFDMKLELLKRYVEKNNRLPKLKMTDLGKWILEKRKLYRNNRLPYRHIRALEGVPCWTWSTSNDCKWEKHFNSLLVYVNTNGVIPNSKISPIGRWAANQRYVYNSGKMPDDRIIKLESVPLWKWSIERFPKKKDLLL